MQTLSAGATLVTGANGFVGRHVCRALAGRGTTALATDIDFDPDMPVLDDVQRVVCDVADAAAVERLFSTQAIDRVVHGGAISGPMLARNDPHKVHRINAMGTLNLLDGARIHGIGRFLLLSSIAVYGDHPTLASVAEDAPLLATEPYGASKVAAERFALSYRHSFAMDVAALRVASVYGSGRRSPCLVQALVDATLAGAAPVLLSHSPQSLRQLIHIDDCVAAILCALDAPKLGQFAYNIANGALSERDVVREVTNVIGTAAMEWMDVPRFFDGHIGALSSLAASRDLGFEARIPLGVGLAGMTMTAA